MKLELTDIEYRRLLDLVYVGNWIMNSVRDNDRITEYDELESRIFSYCRKAGMPSLAETYEGVCYPSRAFEEGGIHEAIADYEDTMFFDILAEELACRDLDITEVTEEKYEELYDRIDDYLDEFDRYGLDHVIVEE
ncbi:MAG: hypothetical protein K6C09_01100 [Oscillospiraceae bacterium]|nr:hypothetical protein [Oscillospiraceae bacterium]